MIRLLLSITACVFSATISFAIDTTDPSSIPLPKDGIHNRERYRVVADFNFDGMPDLALSESLSLFGNGGGMFTFYLGNNKGEYQEIGEILCFPSHIAVENHHPYPRLWIFQRMGGAEGYVGYHEIRNGSMTEFRSLEVFPGDGGTDIGRSIVKAILENSDSVLRVEVSRTVGNDVHWELKAP